MNVDIATEPSAVTTFEVILWWNFKRLWFILRLGKSLKHYLSQYWCADEDWRPFWPFIAFIGQKSRSLDRFFLLFFFFFFFSSPEPKAPGEFIVETVVRRRRRQLFQTTSSLKPPGQFQSNFIYSILAMVDWKFVQTVQVSGPRCHNARIW